MTLTIDLSPELERRLRAAAALRGQAAEEYARTVLEETLAVPEPGPNGERTPEQIVSDFFARYPRRSPSDLVEMARQQGISPVARVEDLVGEGPAEEDDFDIDAFLAARKQWQSEGRSPGEGLAEPDDAAR